MNDLGTPAETLPERFFSLPPHLGDDKDMRICYNVITAKYRQERQVIKWNGYIKLSLWMMK